MTEALDVYLLKRPVGKLWLDERRQFIFQYSPDWVSDANAIPLSLALPLYKEAFADDRARPFFSNLLPESDLRKTIARKLGLSAQNDFALLEAVGGECAGAVSLMPEGNKLEGQEKYHTLDDDALNELMVDLPRRPMLAGEAGIRLSLAGAQNKLPVRFENNQISLPLGVAPSSHILKPPILEYPDSVYNEGFCMMLANRVGLPVPRVDILQKRQALYLIERYDRYRQSDEALVRVHQEDFCQALGIAPDQKYEKEGGPTLAQCFQLLREHSIIPVADIQALLKWVIFNFLIGNADAHGKNISLLLTGQGPRLAPFYDLMSTAVYPGLTERLAMRIGGEDRPDWIIERRWRQFADEGDIGYKLVRQSLVQMTKQVIDEAQELAQQCSEIPGERKVIKQIVGVIESRSNKITRLLAV